MAVDEKSVREALVKAKENSKKRNFTQTYDLIVNLKDLNFNNPEHQVDFYAVMHYGRGKKVKVCALVGPEMKEQAEKSCDKTIITDEFPIYAKDSKLVKKLAKEYHFFIAQANIMPQVATTFGKVFGPRKKMPNPKAGCVVAPGANLKLLYDKLQKTVRLYAKEKPLIQVPVGNETMKDEEVIDNILTVYDQLLHHLPQEKNNIKSVFLKLTMGRPVEIK
ncbi:MAG: 50S ribosomal protein L1 [Candidatus Woesearchaeota archaeon]|nr:50S ribosomal protein L1 [Candidatus Woesearchaeota archaeon]